MGQTKRYQRIRQLHQIINAERKRIFDGAEHPQSTADVQIAHCGECGFTWDDGLSTEYTPVPSGRCPFEYVHEEVRELRRLRAKLDPQWLHRADVAGDGGWMRDGQEE